jgi:hypothetical protein
MSIMYRFQPADDLKVFYQEAGHISQCFRAIENTAKRSD